jgi:adenylate cyclase
VTALQDDRDALIAEVIRREAERGERLVAVLRALMHTSAMPTAMVVLRVLDLPPMWRDLRTTLTMLAPFVTETLTPSELLTTLDAYYGALVPPVYAEGGIVNKFIGDAIMATFGAPAPQDDHATRAAAAARGMVASIAALNGERAKTGQPPLVIGVGIATGPVALGRLAHRTASSTASSATPSTWPRASRA